MRQLQARYRENIKLMNFPRDASALRQPAGRFAVRLPTLEILLGTRSEYRNTDTRRSKADTRGGKNDRALERKLGSCKGVVKL